jgi:hypothetical protein
MRSTLTGRRGTAVAALTLIIGLASGGVLRPAASEAEDACGVCFRTAVFYWENVEWMTGDDVYDWLGTCLEINDC